MIAAIASRARASSHATSTSGSCSSGLKSTMAREQPAQLVGVETVDRHAVAAGHRLAGEQRVDDCLLRRVDDGVEELVEAVVREHRQRLLSLVADSVAGRPREDQVAARVLACAARARDAERGALCEAVAL